MTSEEERAQRLEALVEECRGDVAEAIRRLADITTAELAELIGLSRQSVEQCLRQAHGFKAPHIRRAVEIEIGLPVNSLDRIMAGVRPRDPVT